MCEFTVVVDGEIKFNDAVYAKAEESKIIVKDILGNFVEFENCKIVEVDVNSTRLVLACS